MTTPLLRSFFAALLAGGILTALALPLPAQEDNMADATGSTGDAPAAITDEQLAAFLHDHYLPYAKSTRQLMKGLNSADQTELDIKLDNLVKQLEGLVTVTRKAVVGKAFDTPMQIRQHLLNQNKALLSIRQAAYASIYEAYIRLGKKDLLPVQALITWREIQAPLSEKLSANYDALIKLATEAPVGQAAPAPGTAPTPKTKPAASE